MIPLTDRQLLGTAALLAILLGLAVSLGACNTAEGFGQDLRSAGSEIEDQAEDASD